MNVFVLCTGRCGSTAFINACEHITNFTSAHESRAGMIGKDRLAYSQNHIEADNRLSWYLGRLDQEFGKEAVYVHLQRNIDDVANSYSRRVKAGLMSVFANGILIHPSEDMAPKDLALDACTTITANIHHFLKDKPNKMEMQLERISDDFGVFWELIGAQGDLDAALKTFSNPANSSEENFSKQPKHSLATRVINKLVRLASSFPKYLIET